MKSVRFRLRIASKHLYHSSAVVPVLVRDEQSGYFLLKLLLHQYTQVVAVPWVYYCHLLGRFVLDNVAVVGSCEGDYLYSHCFEVEYWGVNVGMVQSLMTANSPIMPIPDHTIVQTAAQATVVDMVEAAKALSDYHY
jgi:hypothetical protein